MRWAPPPKKICTLHFDREEKQLKLEISSSSIKKVERQTARKTFIALTNIKSFLKSPTKYLSAYCKNLSNRLDFYGQYIV